MVGLMVNSLECGTGALRGRILKALRFSRQLSKLIGINDNFLASNVQYSEKVMEIDVPLDLQVLAMERDKAMERNDDDLVTKSVFARVNESKDKNNTEQRKCRIVHARVEESRGKNNQEQHKTRVGSARTNRIISKNNTEQNLLKIDINSIAVETVPASVIGVEL